jgi:polyvinyl alcohol dehydrogenase (cytochrome)
VLWRHTFGMGTPLGEFTGAWRSTTARLRADQRSVLPVADYVPQPAMNAVEIETGKVAWSKPVQPDCKNGRQERFPLCGERYGLSAAPLVIDKSVVAGAVDGRLYIYDAASGEIVWQYDTLRDFPTLNGIEGKGVSIESHSVFAGAGMLFVGSGYGQFRAPGNVLLAFRPKGK